MKKTSRIWIYPLVIIVMIVMFASSCSKSGDTNDSTQSGIVTDIDGNVYHTVTIGTQIWMVENLKTTKYRNGDPIPNITVNASWATLTNGAYCWYNNDAATNKATYGALYNWFAVVDSRNLAPTGWHVPTDAEWTTLTTYLGGEPVAGGKLKETGTSHWLSPNTSATNAIGFTALPGGGFYLIFSSGEFGDFGYNGSWWSNTAIDATYAFCRSLYYNFADVGRRDSEKQCGFSIRCVKD